MRSSMCRPLGGRGRRGNRRLRRRVGQINSKRAAAQAISDGKEADQDITARRDRSVGQGGGASEIINEK